MAKTIALTIRDALRDGPKTRTQVKDICGRITTRAISRSLTRMIHAGALERDGETFWLTPLAKDEVAYYRHVKKKQLEEYTRGKALRGQSKPAQRPTDETASLAKVNAALKSAW